MLLIRQRPRTSAVPYTTGIKALPQETKKQQKALTSAVAATATLKGLKPRPAPPQILAKFSFQRMRSTTLNMRQIRFQASAAGAAEKSQRSFRVLLHGCSNSKVCSSEWLELINDSLLPNSAGEGLSEGDALSHFRSKPVAPRLQRLVLSPKF